MDTTYTVREPGTTAWQAGIGTLRAARASLAEAKSAGLWPRLYRDDTGEQCCPRCGRPIPEGGQPDNCDNCFNWGD
jgi:hypothetical protein